MSLTEIDGVIRHLEQIVHHCAEENSALGIFALVYLQTTIRVKEGILANLFEEGGRMERMDVLFAKRYLDAYDGFRKGDTITQSWQTAFDAAKDNKLLVLQHLLLGMNAHISLDLGIAAATVDKPETITRLERDFMTINAILTEQIDEMQDRLSSVSPLLFLLDWFGKRNDEHFAAFGIKTMRNFSWQVAKRMAQLHTEQDQVDEIKKLDAEVAGLSSLILNPGRMGRFLGRIVRWFEVKDWRKVLHKLGYNPATDK